MKQHRKEYLADLVEYLKGDVSFSVANDILKFECDSLHEYLESVFSIKKHNPEISRYFNPYEILYLYEHYYHTMSDMKKEVGRSAAYPSLLLLISCVLSYFFSHVLAVQLLDLFKGFSIDLSVLGIMTFIADLWNTLIAVMSILAVSLLFYVRKMSARITVYVLLKKISLLQQYLTFPFALNMKLLLGSGVQSQFLYVALRKISISETSRWLAYYPDDDFQQGVAFKDLYRQNFFDPKFRLMMQHGSNHLNTALWLDNYCKLTAKSMVRSGKRLITALKMVIIAYLVILIAMFYNILYLPMKLMEVL